MNRFVGCIQRPPEGGTLAHCLIDGHANVVVRDEHPLAFAGVASPDRADANFWIVRKPRKIDPAMTRDVGQQAGRRATPIHAPLLFFDDRHVGHESSMAEVVR